MNDQDPNYVPSDELKIAAVELRLLGVDPRLVDHYLHCGDHSVLSMMEWHDLYPDEFEERWRRHLEYMIENGKI